MPKTIEELLATARSDLDDPLVNDADTYCRWKTTELVDYLNRAQREACLRAELLIDGKTKQTSQISLKTGVRDYCLDKRVLWIKEARIDGQTDPIEQKTSAWLDEFDPNWMNRTGKSYLFTTDRSEGYLTLSREPIEDGTLNLVVQRLPLRDVTWTDRSNHLEIPEHSQDLALEWLYHLAYSKHDEDTFNDGRATQHANKFTQFFGPRPTAERLSHKRRASRANRSRAHWF